MADTAMTTIWWRGGAERPDTRHRMSQALDKFNEEQAARWAKWGEG